MKKILFTGGGGAGTEALWRYFSAKYDLYFADATPENIDKIIPYDKRLKVPFANDGNFISMIRKICIEKQIDILVPGVDEELLPLCNNRQDNLPEIFVPSADFVQLMLDKFDCFQAMSTMGMTIPQTVLFSNTDKLSFPFIVKPRSGRGSRGVYIVNNLNELQAYEVLYNVRNDNCIAQELINGVEYTVLVAANNATELTAIVPVKVIQKKGITIHAEIDMNESVIEFAKQFHTSFRPNYIYNIQCMLTSDNKVLAFEINPRISTTFCLSVAAGFDPFEENRIYTEENLFLPSSNFRIKRNWHNYITSE